MDSTLPLGSSRGNVNSALTAHFVKELNSVWKASKRLNTKQGISNVHSCRQALGWSKEPASFSMLICRPSAFELAASV